VADRSLGVDLTANLVFLVWHLLRSFWLNDPTELFESETRQSQIRTGKDRSAAPDSTAKAINFFKNNHIMDVL
jgi:hypothetical protein